MELEIRWAKYPNMTPQCAPFYNGTNVDNVSIFLKAEELFGPYKGFGIAKSIVDELNILGCHIGYYRARAWNDKMFELGYTELNQVNDEK